MLSFDALRSTLDGINSYIIVLDTRGINVWCAAGKGTFGTNEIVHRIQSTSLKEVVRHRKLILPQLGAPGVAAHEVKKQTGFRVEYGPVRAADLPEYLKTRRATSQMRRVSFNLRNRLILIPVELVKALVLILLLVAFELFFRGSLPPEAYEAATSILAGIILFPILLPWIPTYDFSTKGFILGGAVTIPFALLAVFSYNPDAAGWRHISGALAKMLAWPAVTAFLALNFTGSTTFTSRSGVRREIFKYIPIMAGMFGTGVVLTVVIRLI
jgi:hypothetical protein